MGGPGSGPQGGSVNKPGASKANRLSKKAKEATDKARNTQKSEDHDAAAQAHSEAAKAHDSAVGAIGGGSAAVEHHEKMAEMHSNQSINIRVQRERDPNAKSTMSGKVYRPNERQLENSRRPPPGGKLR